MRPKSTAGLTIWATSTRFDPRDRPHYGVTQFLGDLRQRLGGLTAAVLRDENIRMLVSIFLATRNRMALLSEAIDSVLSQDHKDIELIVVNDASSDGTDDLIARRARSDPRVIGLHNLERRGASASRNIAIRMARGEFLMGLDDDDRFMPERISAFVKYWRSLTSTGIMPSCLYSQDLKIRDGRDPTVTQKRSSVTAEDLFVGNFIGSPIFAPTRHFIESGLFDEALPVWNDLEFYIRLLRKFGPAHLLDMATYRVNLGPRPDRLSLQEHNIRFASDYISRMHAQGSPHRMKSLFLAQFCEGRAISPRPGDWIRLLRFGGAPNGIGKLLLAYRK